MASQDGFDMTRYEYELDKIVTSVLPRDHDAHARKRQLGAELGE